MEDRWSTLSMKEKSELMKLFIENGVSSVDEIREIYNQQEREGPPSYSSSTQETLLPVEEENEENISKVMNNPFISSQLKYRIGGNGEIQRIGENKYDNGGYVQRRMYGNNAITLEAYKNIQRQKIIDQAVNNALTRNEGVAPIVKYDEDGYPVYGDSCAYTATDNFGKKYRIAGNKAFNATLGNNGFVIAGPLDSNPENNLGRLYQVFEYVNNSKEAEPKHLALITGTEGDKNTITYSRGDAAGRDNTYYGEGDEYKDYQKNKNIYSSPYYETYRFEGTPEDNNRWESEFIGLEETEQLPVIDSNILSPARIKATGGSIRIKKKNIGKFTALKKRTGHSATWFKLHGTPAQKKMATFELNARKWKHSDGGLLNKPIYTYGGPVIPQQFDLGGGIGRLLNRIFNRNVSSEDIAKAQAVDYLTYDNADEETINRYAPSEIFIEDRNGNKRAYSTTQKANTGYEFYPIIEQRYAGMSNAMRSKGFTEEEIERLTPFVSTQSVNETGWIPSREDNNLGGMRNTKEDRSLTFGDLDEFYSTYIDNLEDKWGDARLGKGKGWRNAKDIKDFARIVNHEDLGILTQKDYDRYNAEHKDSKIYMYTPPWENNGEILSIKLANIYPRVNAMIQLRKEREREFNEYAKKHRLLAVN